ncbi:basic proline-rich protein-like [Suncus etruscus]|uniref:basic proline-rich protein-like n=1 Tax=Suncus etruscus TaxID=109475 RepID=UPI00210F788B|nr:basic proline-rich protein-like [Suncus etruscus]
MVPNGPARPGKGLHKDAGGRAPGPAPARARPAAPPPREPSAESRGPRRAGRAPGDSGGRARDEREERGGTRGHAPGETPPAPRPPLATPRVGQSRQARPESHAPLRATPATELRSEPANPTGPRPRHSRGTPPVSHAHHKDTPPLWLGHAFGPPPVPRIRPHARTTNTPRAPATRLPRHATPRLAPPREPGPGGRRRGAEIEAPWEVAARGPVYPGRTLTLGTARPSGEGRLCPDSWKKRARRLPNVGPDTRSVPQSPVWEKSEHLRGDPNPLLPPASKEKRNVVSMSTITY